MASRKVYPSVIVGETYCGWTVLEASEPARKSGAVFKRWLCRCRCGRVKPVSDHGLRSSTSADCGCGRLERSRLRTLHGGFSGGKATPEYYSWTSMRTRCRNPNSFDYQDYGGRGIKVCNRWDSFVCFLADMGSRPPGCSLDRIDVAGDYEPTNCRWADVYTQAANKRNTTLYLYQGQYLTASALARICGINTRTVWCRLKAGQTVEQAMTRLRAAPQPRNGAKVVKS